MSGGEEGARSDREAGRTRPVKHGHGERSQRFMLVLAVLLLVVGFFIVRPYLSVTVFALIGGFLLHPVYAWLRPRLKFEAAAAGVVMLLLTLAILVPFVVLGVAVADEATALAGMLTDRAGLEERLRDLLARLPVPAAWADAALSGLEERLAQFLSDIAVPAATAVTEFVLRLIIFYILLYFVIVDGHKLVEYVRRVTPLDAKRLDRLVARMGERVKAIVFGTFAVSVIQGATAGVAWWLLGLPSPVLVGFTMMILAVIPVVGPFVVLLPAGLIQLARGEIVSGVILLVLNFVIVGLVDDVVRPYLIGRGASVHAGIILLGIVGGLAFFGVSGLVLGPLLLSLVGPVVEAWAHPENEPLAGADDEEGGGGEEGPSEEH